MLLWVRSLVIWLIMMMRTKQMWKAEEEKGRRLERVDRSGLHKQGAAESGGGWTQCRRYMYMGGAGWGLFSPQSFKIIQSLFFHYDAIHNAKSGNIRDTFIFLNFVQFSVSANSKTRENICDILYTHFGHVGLVYWVDHACWCKWVIKGVWSLLCFYAAQWHLLVNYISLNALNFVQYNHDKWASTGTAQCKLNNPRISLCTAKREKFIPQN